MAALAEQVLSNKALKASKTSETVNARLIGVVNGQEDEKNFSISVADNPKHGG